MTAPKASLSEIILTDLWVHLAGLLAIGIGLFANRFTGIGFSSDTQLLFIIGGFAAMGLKLANGTVAATAAAAADAVRLTAVNVAAQTVSDAKVTAAQTVADAQTTAAQTVATAAAKAGEPTQVIPPVIP